MMAPSEDQSRPADKLSAEESRLWNHIHSSKIQSPLAADHDLSTVRPVVEDDLVAAIATLRGSTLAIERQTELLQSHHRYLNTFGNQRDEKNQAIQGAAGSIARKELLELQQLALQVDEEDKALTSHFESVLEDVSESSKNIKRSLHERLREDDRRLQTLQTLAIPHCEPRDAEISSEKRISALLEKLVDFTCQEIQLRLDRIYLERLRKQPIGQNDTSEDQAAQERSLQNDLDSLYAEIRDVVGMSASQKFESPLLETQRYESDRRRNHDGLALESTLNNLSDLTQSLEDGSNILELYCSYGSSMAAMKAEYSTQSAIHKPSATQPLFTTLEADPLELTAAFLALLRYVGVPSEGLRDRQSIQRALGEKLTRLAQATSNTAAFPDGVLGKTLTENDHCSQLLTTALRDNADVGSKKSSSQTSTTNLEALDDKIAQIRQNVEATDLGQDGEHGKAPNQFLARWS